MNWNKRIQIHMLFHVTLLSKYLRFRLKSEMVQVSFWVVLHYAVRFCKKKWKMLFFFQKTLQHSRYSINVKCQRKIRYFKKYFVYPWLLTPFGIPTRCTKRIRRKIVRNKCLVQTRIKELIKRLPSEKGYLQKTETPKVVHKISYSNYDGRQTTYRQCTADPTLSSH